VGAAFAQEQSRLLALPANPFVVEERLVITVAKTPYVEWHLLKAEAVEEAGLSI